MLKNARVSSSLQAATIANPGSVALRVHSVQINFLANYEQHLESTIFRGPVEKLDSKLLRKHRRTLKTMDSYKVLALLWKESEFVTDVVAPAGFRKQYGTKDLTAHHLAADLADGAHDVGALYSRIRNIALAASSFGLVDRESLNATTVPLKGTFILHEFMTMDMARRD